MFSIRLRSKPDSRPNILFVMTDQQRFDTVSALGNPHIYTPNLDRLVRRGVTFSNAYSTCPVCIAARHTIRTGREPGTTLFFRNNPGRDIVELMAGVEERCGEFLARTLRRGGYRTFGIGKFHTWPRDMDLGYDVHLHSEEQYGSPIRRQLDDYAAWLKRNYPAYDCENLMGERTEMYYIPQRSPMPAEATVERWAADRAVEQISAQDRGPWFGMVSFIGPHPPFAPPVPFNRLYDPDRMPSPVKGDIEADHLDASIPLVNWQAWAEDINDPLARILKARYYGEISYIDDCLGRVLDCIEARSDADNTLICFFADHGENLGDHHAWQKSNFFEESCRVPFLLSWPDVLPRDARRDELVCLTDLFGIATSAAGQAELRDGIDVLGILRGDAAPRSEVIGMFGSPGTPDFKVMVRTAGWKYIYLANGDREQLFDLDRDPAEHVNLASEHRDKCSELHKLGAEACRVPGSAAAIDGGRIRAFEFQQFKRHRDYQFDRSMGVTGFPEKPADVLNPPHSAK